MVLAVAAANVELRAILVVKLSGRRPLIFYRRERERQFVEWRVIGSRRLHSGIDHPDLAVRIRPQELRHSSTDAVITGDPAADKNPASLPLGEGEGLNARGAGELAARVLGRIHGKREMACREQREYGKSVHSG